MLRFDLCDFSDAYIIFIGKIIITAPDNNADDKKIAFKNNAPFIGCVTKINNTLINYAEDLDIGMPMYTKIVALMVKVTTEYSITGKLEGDNAEKDDVRIVVRLKHLSNFWRTLDMPLMNCKVSLTLTWSENCVITSKSYRRVVAAQGNNPAVDGIDNPIGATFKIKDTKLYVPVVTLSTENDNRLLEQLKTGFFMKSVEKSP